MRPIMMSGKWGTERQDLFRVRWRCHGYQSALGRGSMAIFPAGTPGIPYGGGFTVG